MLSYSFMFGWTDNPSGGLEAFEAYQQVKQYLDNCRRLLPHRRRGGKEGNGGKAMSVRYLYGYCGPGLYRLGLWPYCFILRRAAGATYSLRTHGVRVGGWYAYWPWRKGR